MWGISSYSFALSFSFGSFILFEIELKTRAILDLGSCCLVILV